LNFHGGQSSDEDTAIHDNTTAGTSSKLASAGNSAIDEASTSLFPATSVGIDDEDSSSAKSDGSVDSTKATVTKQASQSTSAAAAVATPDEKSLGQASSPLAEDDDGETKPLWQCRLEDMRLRQTLMEELMQREERAAPYAPAMSPPRRTELPVKMHGQVVAGEEDWSKDFADGAFVTFDDDIFGRSEI